MNADSEGTEGAAPDDVVGEPAPDPSADAGAEGAARVEDPTEDLKAKYREALAHKHGSQGAAHSGHGDDGGSTHGHEQAHAHRMFRRKSG
jgi:hypothetical protein